MNASSGFEDADVFDIEFTVEGMDTIAYIGVYASGKPATAHSIYKLTQNATGWTVEQDMTSTTTSTGTSISATIRDLEVSSSGGTIYAAGTDVGVNHPIAYYKPLNATNLWTPLTTSGFPAISGKKGYVITLGVDSVYRAVDHEIYLLPLASSSWILGYAYPVGTEINFLLFDELLIGTGTGLYSHIGNGVVGTDRNSRIISGAMTIFPNPAKNKIYLEVLLDKTSYINLRIIGLDGKLIALTSLGNYNSGSHTIPVNTAYLSNGSYIIYAETRYKSFVANFIKE